MQASGDFEIFSTCFVIENTIVSYHRNWKISFASKEASNDSLLQNSRLFLERVDLTESSLPKN